MRWAASAMTVVSEEISAASESIPQCAGNHRVSDSPAGSV